MLRVGSTRSLLHASSRAAAAPKRPISSLRRFPEARHSRHVLAAAAREVSKAVSARPLPLTQQASYATKNVGGFQIGIDPEADKKAGQRKLEVDPAGVTTESSVRHVYEPADPGQPQPVKEGISDDLETVKETFSLANTPNEPYWLGLAGTLPYLGTSVSTVYLAWVLNTPWPSPSAFANNIMINQEWASQLLATLEPIQLGYGAVIISFLGAIHWGLEYAAKTPDRARTRFRYGIGVLAPIFAWPTLFLPVEFALTSQFAAFVALYFADARATVRGWAPAWYSTYRFALTAVVGVAIAISLIGRAKVGDASPRLTGLSEKFHQRHGEEDYTEKWQKLERKDIEKSKKKQEEAERKKEEEEKAAKAKEQKKSGEGKDQKEEQKKSGENKDQKEEQGDKGQKEEQGDKDQMGGGGKGKGE
ncbi:hypothetical protein F4802DRAFT_578905 [Xylaria palmicola]|nr:hypothetical protein F4802DRAFT_578905 [Xylaria palmicola]